MNQVNDPNPFFNLFDRFLNQLEKGWAILFFAVVFIIGASIAYTAVQ